MLTEEQADNAWSTASCHTPKSASWGFFSYLDVPPAFCGSGAGGFLWFPSQEKMHAFLATAYPCSTRLNDETKQAVCDQAREKILLAPEDSAGLMKLLNEELAGHLQLEWVGTLKDLRSGDHRYAVYLRARFRTDNQEDFSGEILLESPLELLEQYGQPLKAGERADFMDFIAEWGI